MGIRTDMRRLSPGQVEPTSLRRSFAQQRAEKASARNTASPSAGSPRAAGNAVPAASLLQLIWLASPALPVGGFSYSEGLEASVEWCGVTSESIASELAERSVAPVARARRSGRGGQGPGRLATRRPGPCTCPQRLGAANPRNQRNAPAGRADGPLAGGLAAQPGRRPARSPARD